MQWLANYVMPNYKPRTCERYRSMVEQHIIPIFVSMKCLICHLLLLSSLSHTSQTRVHSILDLREYNIITADCLRFPTVEKTVENIANSVESLVYSNRYITRRTMHFQVHRPFLNSEIRSP